jgi:hypothetical protein
VIELSWEDGTVGQVRWIGLRSTQLRVKEGGHLLTIPNGQISTQKILNYTVHDHDVDKAIQLGFRLGLGCRHGPALSDPHPKSTNSPGILYSKSEVLLRTTLMPFSNPAAAP